MFKKMTLQNWRQFKNVEIEFHDKLTILTGANGSGKTTLLNILGKHFGWNMNLTSQPQLSDEGDILYSTDVWDYEDMSVDSSSRITKDTVIIGHVEYSEGGLCNVRVPKKAGTTYQMSLEKQVQQKGLMLSSHRNVFRYQAVTSIPTKPVSRENAYNKYSNYLISKYNESYVGDNGATQQIKETLISWAIYGYGNEVVKANNEARELFEGFQTILKCVLPPSLGFVKIEIDNPEVVMITKTGRFSIDAVSGGIAALIEICWQIYMRGKKEEVYSVIIDEPENHLHPELQRTIMPSLLKAFPNVQFIVATHNPFVIGSAEKSKVYVLDYNEDDKVLSYCLNEANKAGTANEILRDVLGIPVTMGDWVEEKLNKIVEKYSGMSVSKETISEMRAELEAVGLKDMIPEMIIKVLENAE